VKKLFSWLLVLGVIATVSGVVGCSGSTTTKSTTDGGTGTGTGTRSGTGTGTGTGTKP
jgi:hypothetical protein